MPLDAHQSRDYRNDPRVISPRAYEARDLQRDHHQRGVVHGYDAPVAGLNPEILGGLQKPSIDALLRSLQKHRPDESTQHDQVLADFHHTLHLIWGYMDAHKYDVSARHIRSDPVLDRDLKDGRDHRWQVECLLDAANNLEVSYFLRDDLGKRKSAGPVFNVVYKVDNSETGNQIMYDPKDNATISGVLSESELLEPTNVLRFSDQKATPGPIRAALGR